jgi:hypothetical protein
MYMNKYHVNIQEISYGYVEVEAASEDEAREKALEIRSEGNANWGKMDAETTTVIKLGCVPTIKSRQNMLYYESWR